MKNIKLKSLLNESYNDSFRQRVAAEIPEGDGSIITGAKFDKLLNGTDDQPYFQHLKIAHDKMKSMGFDPMYMVAWSRHRIHNTIKLHIILGSKVDLKNNSTLQSRYSYPSISTKGMSTLVHYIGYGLEEGHGNMKADQGESGSGINFIRNVVKYWQREEKAWNRPGREPFSAKSVLKRAIFRKKYTR